MDTNVRFVQVLCKRIHNGKFAWEKYQNGGWYHIPNLEGREIQTKRIFCSYGLCGYSVWFPYSKLPEIQWDFDLRELSVDGVSLKQWIYWQENYMRFLIEWAKAETHLDFAPYVVGKYHIEVPANY